jgi:hypothetical protein
VGFSPYCLIVATDTDGSFGEFRNAHALDSNPMFIIQKCGVHSYAEGSVDGDEIRL